MTECIDRIKREIEESIAVAAELANSGCDPIGEVARLILTCLRAGNKLLVFGNGGSAAEAQHFVAELVGRYRIHRQALAAVALTSESASVTAIANDYGFEEVFSRQLQALAKPGDVVVAISTSGNSPNILAALRTAKDLRLHTVGITGKTGGQLVNLVHIALRAPSDCTPRIQEAHMLMIHLVCGLVEDAYLSPHKSHSALGEVR